MMPAEFAEECQSFAMHIPRIAVEDQPHVLQHHLLALSLGAFGCKSSGNGSSDTQSLKRCAPFTFSNRAAIGLWCTTPSVLALQLVLRRG